MVRWVKSLTLVEAMAAMAMSKKRKGAVQDRTRHAPAHHKGLAFEIHISKDRAVIGQLVYSWLHVYHHYLNMRQRR